MFEAIFSSADKLVEAGEEIKETQYRSRLAPSYLTRFAGAGGLIIAIAAIALVGETTPVLPSVIPSQYVGVLLVIPFAVILWIEVEHHALMYHFTDKRMIKEHGVFSKSFESVPYKDVTRVTVSQDPTDRLLRIGNLRVEVRGMDQEEVVVTGIRHPQQFRLKLTTEQPAADEAKEQDVEQIDHEHRAASSGSDLFTADVLQAELGHIQRRKEDLDREFNNGRISQQEYQRRWYMLAGEERIIEWQLDALEEQQETAEE